MSEDEPALSENEQRLFDWLAEPVVHKASECDSADLNRLMELGLVAISFPLNEVVLTEAGYAYALKRLAR